MNGMFNPNNQLPPDVLEAMLNLSNTDVEKEQLSRQNQMGKLLSNSALDYRPMGGGKLGGLMGAAAQGLQGYMAGKNYAEGNQKLMDFGTEQKKRRKTFMDWLYTGSENVGSDGVQIGLAPQE